MRHSEYRGVPNTSADHHGPLTVGSSVVTLLSLTGALHAGTNFLVLTTETNSVRMTFNGTAPSATVGMLVPADTAIILSRAESDTCKLIRVTSDATLQVMEYKA